MKMPSQGVVTWYGGIVYAISALLFTLGASAQNIPMGAWRFHLSFHNIDFVALAQKKIYAASASGVIVYDRDTQSLTALNKLNGLSGTGISAIAATESTEDLVVGYRDGTLDILHENTITPFTRLRDTDITASKQIGHIVIRGSLAYLSTAYGLVVFDLARLEINETWRDLGSSGETVEVFQSVFRDDSVYLATSEGILAGNLNDNLLDFNKWKRFSMEEMPAFPKRIAVFEQRLYAASGGSLYVLDQGVWSVVFRADEPVTSLTTSPQDMLLIAGRTVYTVNSAGKHSIIDDPVLHVPREVRQDSEGNLWIADEEAGLLANRGGAFSSYIPNGPSANNIRKLAFHKGKIFAMNGGFTGAAQPLNSPGDLNIFENGQWTTTPLEALDLTDVAFFNGKKYVSSFGDGILVADASGATTTYDETNSPLVNPEPGVSRVTAFATSAEGLWVAHYGGTDPLHLLKNDGSWESFSFHYANAAYPHEIAVDRQGRVWLALNPATGGGIIVYDRLPDQSNYISTAAGAGALNDARVYSLAPDREGYMWTGTGGGVVYFFSPTDDAVKPIYENRFLLRDEKITALAIDAGNRKWIGTEQGVWLFNSTGEELIHHFTGANSPLLSNVIHDIEIHPETGEVFFATDLGVVSFRSDAMQAGPRFGRIKIFPNPVSPAYSGTVGISGLAQDAEVRITDIAGNLIWQTRANGGAASWRVRDHHGRRLNTGIYLVFASSPEGSESVVGKIAVIE